MTEQVQKKKYIIKRVLDEEEVKRIKDELAELMFNVKAFYYGLLSMIDEPAIKAYESNRQEAEKDLFLNADVRRFMQNYVKAYVLYHLLRYGYLPDIAKIIITYITKDRLAVRVVVNAKELSYLFGVANFVPQAIDIISFEASDSITPQKIVNKIINDIDRLIDMYRWDFQFESNYRLDLEYAVNWLRQHNEEVDENKIKALTERKAKILNRIVDFEDLLKTYRL